MRDDYGSEARSLVFTDSWSVRRYLVFRDSEANNGEFGFTKRLLVSDDKMEDENTFPTIRWRRGERIGSGAYGRVYMGMNLDSGELLAVKHVLIAASNGSKEKVQDHIRELEEEVKLLRNLSHRNIVRYLGLAREEHTFDILLEFVPGGSISSLLGKFGSFAEPVIRKYTKQLLQGLEYLHKYGIIHRDIKGANILVDDKGCIKLADFGASKQLLELEIETGAKSTKGTPYWMAPEVLRPSGHGLSADIWSVGCTVIEMATGKPPWGEEVKDKELGALLYHIATTKSHPPIPDHLSSEAKDFLLKCLKIEPNLRPSASELLQHPFVVGESTNASAIPRSPSQPLQFLFTKQLDTTDTGKLCWLIIPRRYAVQHILPLYHIQMSESFLGDDIQMPESSIELDFPVFVLDSHSQKQFRLRYWKSGNFFAVSSSGWTEIVRNRGLRAHDTLTFFLSSANMIFVSCQRVNSFS